jgi:vancomycin resistance protein YoaR
LAGEVTGGTRAGGSRRLTMAGNPSKSIIWESIMSAKKAGTAPNAKKSKGAMPATPEETNKNDSAKASKAAKVKEAQPKKVSAIDAAAKVLAESGQAMNCQEMIKAMAEKGYWTSPGGKTPQATLYSSILRELQTKGKDARFKKTERGRFTVAG